MNILLISPNTLTVPYPVYPIGLDYIAGAMAKEHQVRIVDMLTSSQDELTETIQEFAPDIIGISIRNIDNTDSGDSRYFLRDHRDLVHRLREISTALIVCGGSGFTIMPERILALLEADFGIIGEGERFTLLVDALAAGDDPGRIPGVMVPGKKSDWPPPWQEKPIRRFSRDAAHVPFYLRKGGMLNLQTKRGCSFRCIYCSYPHIEGKTHRLIDPEEVARTALELEQAGAKYLFFTDSTFNSDIRHSLAVARALKKCGVSLPWGAFFAPTRLPDEYFTIMAETGCRHVEFGTESLSDIMLESYRKPFRVQDVLVAHQQAKSAGLHVAHYFLLGGPLESQETVTETLAVIKRLERSVFFFFIGVRIYPGTPLYDTALAEKKIDPRTDLLQPVFYQPDEIDMEAIRLRVSKQAAGRRNWIIGTGDQQVAGTMTILYQRGYTGPLWEYLAG